MDKFLDALAYCIIGAVLLLLLVAFGNLGYQAYLGDLVAQAILKILGIVTTIGATFGLIGWAISRIE